MLQKLEDVFLNDNPNDLLKEKAACLVLFRWVHPIEFLRFQPLNILIIKLIAQNIIMQSFISFQPNKSSYENHKFHKILFPKYVFWDQNFTKCLKKFSNIFVFRVPREKLFVQLFNFCSMIFVSFVNNFYFRYLFDLLF